MSVDLIGSTEYKLRHFNSAESAHSGWAPVLMSFYTDFQNKFSENWQQWTSRYENTNSPRMLGPPPKLWKALGDELLFWKECQSHDEICGIIQVWRKTLNDFRGGWSHSELKFKSGAWLVGSPVRNWEVAFLRGEPNNADRNYLGDSISYNFNLLKQYYDTNCERKIDIDFIGPSMDCGFRLLSLATEEKFILSADLAYLLAQNHSQWGINFKDGYPSLTFFVDKTVSLKGVTSVDKEYPVFWLKAMPDDDASPENVYMAKMRRLRDEDHKGVKIEDMTRELEYYLSQVYGFPDLPYICAPDRDGVDIVYGEMPEDHVNRINQHRQTYLNAAKVEQDIISSFEDGNEGDAKTSAEIDRIAEQAMDGVSKPTQPRP